MRDGLKPCSCDSFAVHITLDMAGQPTNRGSPSLLLAGTVISGLASLGALVAMIVIAVLKVRGGEGLEMYRTLWLVENNWIGFLTFLAVAVVAVFVGLLLRLKEWREVQELQKKYGAEADV